MWDLVKFVIGIMALIVMIRACHSINEAVDTIHNSTLNATPLAPAQGK